MRISERASQNWERTSTKEASRVIPWLAPILFNRVVISSAVLRGVVALCCTKEPAADLESPGIAAINTSGEAVLTLTVVKIGKIDTNGLICSKIPEL